MSSTRTLFLVSSCLALTLISLTLVLKKWHLGLREEGGGDDGPDADLKLDLTSEKLIQQLRERQQELLPFYLNSTGDQTGNETLNEEVLGSEQGIGCSDLSGMTVVDLLGSGYTKTVLKVLTQQGSAVALKSVNEQGSDMRTCLEDFRDPQGCQELVSFKLRKEVILLQRLKHPNIVELRGQCRESGLVGGMVAVLEPGTPLQMIQLLQSPWEERFRVCLGLVRLLQYLSRSPLGSVALLDFQPRQFITVSGELKLTDLDDAVVREPSCRIDSDCLLQFPLRNFTLPCSSSGVCEGLNQLRNLYNAYRYFFIYLLPHQAPALLKPLVEEIMNTTGELKKNVEETLEDFEKVLHEYKSGLHLQNLQPSVIKDYAVVRGVKTAGDMDYRCWPSYEQQACVLSVHNALEAAHICSSHPQCTSFSLSRQRTWTGRRLASFRSGFSQMLPDVNSTLYMRSQAGVSTAAKL
ncbi:extracellular tyrosine-protein kinase PKDCC-like [Astyanax mexicanus]|uniref:Extracellular tyrosine-protein kinase PKDCC n=1 Tax=Astyanax mexicanus TaxID=7994 RepID=A0A8T2LGT9_ASTMX|nr:extracellular tyrosine-protein kinase PKDCC-like [Astyanax mexicanus]